MMKKLALLLLLAFTSVAQAENTVGPTTQIICNKVAISTISSATTTSLVAGVAGQSIFSCGWHVTTSQAAPGISFQFEYGTQADPVLLQLFYHPPSTFPTLHRLQITSL